MFIVVMKYVLSSCPFLVGIVFMDIMAFSLKKSQPSFQRKSKPSRKLGKLAVCFSLASCLHIFNPEDGGNMFT
jgi:hypothetical protein